jgi:hypothetical protein
MAAAAMPIPVLDSLSAKAVGAVEADTRVVKTLGVAAGGAGAGAGVDVIPASSIALSRSSLEELIKTPSAVVFSPKLFGLTGGAGGAALPFTAALALTPELCSLEGPGRDMFVLAESMQRTQESLHKYVEILDPRTTYNALAFRLSETHAFDLDEANINYFVEVLWSEYGMAAYRPKDAYARSLPAYVPESERVREKVIFKQHFKSYLHAISELYQALVRDKGSVKVFFSSGTRTVKSASAREGFVSGMSAMVKGFASLIPGVASMMDLVEGVTKSVTETVLEQQEEASGPGDLIKKLQEAHGNFTAKAPKSHTEWLALIFDGIMFSAAQRFLAFKECLEWLALQPGGLSKFNRVKALTRLEDQYYLCMHYMQEIIVKHAQLSAHAFPATAEGLRALLQGKGPVMVQGFLGPVFHRREPKKVLRLGIEVLGWDKDTFVGEEVIKAQFLFPKNVLVVGVSLPDAAQGLSQALVYFVDPMRSDLLYILGFDSFHERMKMVAHHYPDLATETPLAYTAERYHLPMSSVMLDTMLDSIPVESEADALEAALASSFDEARAALAVPFATMAAVAVERPATAATQQADSGDVDAILAGISIAAADEAPATAATQQSGSDDVDAILAGISI